MVMKRVLLVLSLVTVLAPLGTATHACTLCGMMLNKNTLRGETQQAKMVVYGYLANEKLNGGLNAAPGSGSTELHIVKVIKPHAALDGKKMIVIDRYIPILDRKNPPRYLVFVNLVEGKLDPYFGRPADSPDLLKYLEGVVKLDSAAAPERLAYFYQYLDHADDVIAADAFLEFAKTDDRVIGEVAPKLDAGKFRKLLVDPKTPAERLGMLAFLVGASKKAQDADVLRGMIERPTTRTQPALDGALCGYIQLEPEGGWQAVYNILADRKRSFNDRYAAFRVLRFYYNWDAKGYRPQIMHGLNLMLQDTEADFAVKSLRDWEIWDLTPAILALYGKKGYDTPIMKRAILMYAVACPRPEAKGFVADIRKADAQLIQQIEEDLDFENKLKKVGS
jgi:hypothetical protein